jgi:glycosyltransferase involved in cell wall biosynthesis
MPKFAPSISEEKRRSILFVVRTLDIGGAEKQVICLAEHLKREKHECHVFSLEIGGPLEGSLRQMGVPVYSGNLKRGDINRVPWKLFLVQIKLIRMVRRLRPRVVHSFLPLMTFMGALAARVNRVPVVITSRRALGTHQERHSLLKPLDQLAIRLSDYVTVNSKAVWDDTANRDHIDPAKLRLIYNGIDTDSFEAVRNLREEVRGTLGLKADDKVIIVVANFISYKGHLDFLEAVKKVILQIPQVKVLLVGEDRGTQKDVERRAENLGISNSIQYLGRRDDVSRLLAAADLSVLPSHEEGFSNVILESMAAGLPVVATRVGGNSEAVVDGVSGWLVQPRQAATIAEKIVDLLGDSQRATSWGKRGSERVKENFTVERMVEAHLKLYAGQN